MYSFESNIPNECPNIFMRRKMSRMNVRIYSLWKNSQIFERMNIFVNKYLNIFEYPNICYTLVYFAHRKKNNFKSRGYSGLNQSQDRVQFVCKLITLNHSSQSKRPQKSCCTRNDLVNDIRKEVKDRES